jgi:hypothetical protein
VEAGNDHNPMFLHLEEDSIGKTPDARTPPPAMDDRKLQWMFGNCLNRSFYRPRKAFPKLGAYTVVPGACLLQFGVRVRQPDDGKRYGFLNSFALTCSQEMTSEGFF